MKGHLHKTYDFASIVTEQDLKSLSLLVSSKFDFIKYEFKTKDGEIYSLDNLDDIINFDNPDYRKIVQFRIKGNRNQDSSFVFPNISISLCDNTIYKESCVIDLRNLEDTEITYFSQRINDFVKQIKTPYWWCHKPIFYCAFCTTLYIGLFFLLNALFAFETDKASILLIRFAIGFFCGYLSFELGTRLVAWLYPEYCFCIGEQKKYIYRKEKSRGIILWSIIAPLLLGIIATIIAPLLLKYL